MKRKRLTKRNFNINYFDEIDTEDKAYWIGFLWCDGYLGYRIRERGIEEYNLKLALSPVDEEHLVKFNKCIEGDYKVKTYTNNGFSGEKLQEKRLFITNKYFGKVLREKYGIVPNRNDATLLLNSIPSELEKHFIRGILDADGSFSKYQIQVGDRVEDKYILSFGSCEMILKYIEKHLIHIGIIADMERKLRKRHKEEDRDGSYLTLPFSGANQVSTILKYLYNDSSMYLDRKFKKFVDMTHQL